MAFPVAVEDGIIADPYELAQRSNQASGVTLSSGYIPNSKGAGITKIGNGDELAVYDHVSVDSSHQKLIIRPTSKEKITTSGKIQGEGVVIVHLPDHLIKIASIAIDVQIRPWLAHRLAKCSQRLSKIGIFQARCLELPEYELQDIDKNNKTIIAKPRVKYF